MLCSVKLWTTQRDIELCYYKTIVCPVSDPSLELDESEDNSDDENISSAQDNPVSLSEDAPGTISVASLVQKETEMSSVKSLDEATPTVSPPETANSPSDKESSTGLPQVEFDQVEVAKAVSETEKPKRLKDLLTAGVEDKYNADGSPVEAGDSNIIEVGTVYTIYTSWYRFY